MVQKFRAYYQGKIINAFEALKLKRKRLISTRKSEAEMFDSKSPDAFPLLPKKPKNGIGLPYFSYYPNLSPSMNAVRSGSEITLAHVIFQDVFLKLSYFTIKDQDIEVTVFPREVTVDKIIIAKNHHYTLDIAYRLEKTSPYSYFYKWNGVLAVEIVVTTMTDKQKVDDLGEQGIQICEIKVPKNVELKLREYDKKIISEEYFNQIYTKYYEKYLYLYQKPNFFAFSNLLGKVRTLPKWLERYEKMAYWEEQEKEMLNRIELAKKQLFDLNQDILQKKTILKNIQNEMLDKEELLAKINSLQQQMEIKDRKLDQEYKEKIRCESKLLKYKKKVEEIEASPFKYLFNNLIKKK
ncbi:hypothetical protein [Enterococcus faecium]|uniref:Uncharacterized protein n=1 Tax=Enterococcus faecium TaxID=1352 RepID=A0A242AMP0_ENTFC|nr:hypothetical protein [Enterococcus faecium]OTN82318.1 hypothetical protein A5810_003148 [Enterococcus faecium]